jgi:hypothetical protein
LNSRHLYRIIVSYYQGYKQQNYEITFLSNSKVQGYCQQNFDLVWFDFGV